jgi:two-component system chemotaxis response regulator CheB
VALRVIVLCASAGGVEALGALLAALPPDLPATVLAGLHLPRASPSLLPQVLARRSTLPVLTARDGLSLVPGTVVVGVPDRHLLVVDGHVALGRGDATNGHRPSHDAMLRSAALAAGPLAVGVVLTGLLDDGSAGLRCIDRYHGTCLVQDPGEAAFPDMPRHALHAVPSASYGTLLQLADHITRTVHDDPPAAAEVEPEQQRLDLADLARALDRPPTMSDA